MQNEFQIRMQFVLCISDKNTDIKLEPASLKLVQNFFRGLNFQNYINFVVYCR